MIKEGSYTMIEGRGPVVPYQGKYAVKSAEVFERIHAGWDRVGLNNAVYRPLRIEVELTSKCNDSCPSCGMGALPLQAGRTLTADQIERLVNEFASIALPSIAITGGEPFVATRQLFALIRAAAAAGIDISKLTTNGNWGSARRCGPTFDRLTAAGLMDNILFVPLLMVSVGEQTTPLEYVCRIIHHVVTEFTDRDLNIAVSSLADPADRQHKIYQLMDLYERAYGEFPHERVHSTMRVYLENDRLEGQAPIRRPGSTPISKWMDHCYDCFAPTVGAYVLPTALLKQSGDLYACAAFNVPEKLRFGNLLHEAARDVVARVSRSPYVTEIRDGGGLKAMRRFVPPEVAETKTCGSFCGSCALLIDEFEQRTGRTGPGGPALPLIDPSALWARAAKPSGQSRGPR
jgi:hypothetical protein